MTEIKNEHFMYAYCPLIEGGNLLILGITDKGVEYLKETEGNFLTMEPPDPTYCNVKKSIVVYGKDKEALHKLFEQASKMAKIPLYKRRY